MLYDERTEAFLRDRWHSRVGNRVRKMIFDAIEHSEMVEAILDDRVLKVPEYGTWFTAEYYPHQYMAEDTFWVLHNHDLRGFFFNELKDYRGTASLAKMRLDYSIFPKATNLSGANLEMTSLDRTTFYECTLTDTFVGGAGGVETNFGGSDMRGIILWRSAFKAPDLTGCDMRGAYLEQAKLDEPIIDFRTRLDETIRRTWSSRHIDDLEAARVYHQLWEAHRRHRFFGKADAYHVKERRMARQQIGARLREAADARTRLMARLSVATDIGIDLFFGYGVRPARVALWSLAIIVLFAAALSLFDLIEPSPDFPEALYVSVLAFTTFGFGDASSPAGAAGKATMALDAVVGAILTAVFVVTLARKVIRD